MIDSRSFSPHPGLLYEHHESANGVNVGALLPHVIYKGVAEVSGQLKNLGADFISLLPTRMVPWHRKDVPVIPVWFFEGPWNPPAHGELLGLAGLFEVAYGRVTRNPEAAQLQDWVAFPEKKVAEERFASIQRDNAGATLITHGLYDPRKDTILTTSRRLLEVNPGMDNASGAQMSIDELVGLLDNHFDEDFFISGLDVDAAHIRRALRADEKAKFSGRGQPTHDYLGEPERVIRRLEPYIKLIDFQALTPDELEKTLNGQPTELSRIMTQLLQQNSRLPIRVELNLGLPTQLIPGRPMKAIGDSLAYLRKLRGTIK